MSIFNRVENMVDPFQEFDAATPSKNILTYIKSHIGPYRKVISIILFVGFVSAMADTFLIYYAGRLIDIIAGIGPESIWSRHGIELLLAGLVIVVLKPLATSLNYLLMFNGFSANMMSQARWRAHKHMLGQSMSFFQNDFAGRLSNRVLNMGMAVEDSIFLVLEGFWTSIVFLIGMLVVLAQMDIRLVIPLMIWITCYISYAIWLARRIGVASKKLSNANSRVTARVVDAYANIETVKLFSHAEREEKFALTAMKRHRLRFAKIMRMFSGMIAGVQLFNAAAVLILVLPAVWLWSVGQLSIGEVTAIVALTIRLAGMAGWIMFLTTKVFERIGMIHEGLESIAVPHAITDAPGAPALKVSNAEIRIENLSHHYGKGFGGLDNINLTIKPGERLGLIGRSGSGKSSLVNLLLRFQDVEQGQMLIDGQAVNAVTQDSLRAEIGVVTQDNSLLHRSIQDNILYGKPEATQTEMINAAKSAEAHEFIQDLSDPKGRTGYHAHVGERGVKLSGGQRQRVAIARVILKDAPILVLDEATSALDSEVEASIQKTLYGIMKGKTVIAIAHRLSTIAQMDRIVVLDAGRVAEQGTHNELLALDGLYAGFWNRQSGGFIGVEPTK
ncbi:MAG: ABC transporter ATP-binding protein [Paracoccaceae bacterium]